MQVGKSGSICQLLIIEAEIFFFCFALFFFLLEDMNGNPVTAI